MEWHTEARSGPPYSLPCKRLACHFLRIDIWCSFQCCVPWVQLSISVSVHLCSQTHVLDPPLLFTKPHTTIATAKFHAFLLLKYLLESKDLISWERLQGAEARAWADSMWCRTSVKLRIVEMRLFVPLSNGDTCFPAVQALKRLFVDIMKLLK